MALLCVSVLGLAAWLAWLYFASSLPSIDERYLRVDAFEAQYGEKIYRYRVLSRMALGSLSSVLEPLTDPIPLFARRWSPLLLAIFVLNAAFLALTTWQLFHLVYRSRFLAVRPGRHALAFLALSAAVTLTGMTVTAYDFIAYYLLLVTAWFCCVYLERPRPTILAAIVLLTALGTLNRETAALGVAFLATLLVDRHGLRQRVLRPIAVATAAFVGPYLVLRLWLGWGSATHNRSELLHNLGEPLGLAGLCAWLLLTAACVRWAQGPRHRRRVLLFNAAAAPYWAMCLYAGRMEELRLLVPLLLLDFWLATGRVDPPRR